MASMDYAPCDQARAAVAAHACEWGLDGVATHLTTRLRPSSCCPDATLAILSHTKPRRKNWQRSSCCAKFFDRPHSVDAAAHPARLVAGVLRAEACAQSRRRHSRQPFVSTAGVLRAQPVERRVATGPPEVQAIAPVGHGTLSGSGERGSPVKRNLVQCGGARNSMLTRHNG